MICDVNFPNFVVMKNVYHPNAMDLKFTSIKKKKSHYSTSFFTKSRNHKCTVTGGFGVKVKRQSQREPERCLNFRT